MHLNVSSAKWRQFCLGLNVLSLMYIYNVCIYKYIYTYRKGMPLEGLRFDKLHRVGSYFFKSVKLAFCWKYQSVWLYGAAKNHSLATQCALVDNYDNYGIFNPQNHGQHHDMWPHFCQLILTHDSKPWLNFLIGALWCMWVRSWRCEGTAVLLPGFAIIW